MTNNGELSFEDAYAQLESIIARLESGDISLADSVELYKQGHSLSQYCQKLLDQAELQVKEISEDAG